MLVPFAWMLSSSLKRNNEVFTVPIQWIPEEFRWANYVDIWERDPTGDLPGQLADPRRSASRCCRC